MSYHKSSSSLYKRQPTGVVLPQLRRLFLAREESSPKPLPEGESPDKYRQEHHRCPPGYHIDEETGKCLTIEDLISKLQKQKAPEKKPEEKKKPEIDKEHPPLRELRSKGDDPDYEEILESCRDKFSAMSFVPKGVRKSILAPFKFLSDRYKKGAQKWSDAVAKEAEELQKKGPFFSSTALSPEEEVKAIKRMNSAWHRWGHALSKTYGKAADWLSKRGPKGAAKDIAHGIGGALSFVGRRVGDIAEVLGGVVQKHKIVGSVIGKIAAGRFDEITKTEKVAAYEVGIEMAEVALLTLAGGHAMKGHSSVHQKALEHASESASEISEASMGEALLGHASEMSDETTSLASEAAAVSSTLGHAAHKYLGTIEVVTKVRTIDSIAHGIVHGEHLEHGKKHASLITAEENTRSAASYFSRKLMEHLLEGLKGYKPSDRDVFRGMRAAADVLKLHHLAKLEKSRNVDEKEEDKVTSDPEISKGIIEKVEKTSMVRPGKRDYYDHKAMRKIGARFRKSMKKLTGSLYEDTWINSAPHNEEDTLRNYGDVVVELKKDFQKSPNWGDLKKKIFDLIRSYERDYPGITFSFTTKGKGRSVILGNSHKYQYPGGDEGVSYVYHIDSLVSIW